MLVRGENKNKEEKRVRLHYHLTQQLIYKIYLAERHMWGTTCKRECGKIAIRGMSLYQMVLHQT